MQSHSLIEQKSISLGNLMAICFTNEVAALRADIQKAKRLEIIQSYHTIKRTHSADGLKKSLLHLIKKYHFGLYHSNLFYDLSELLRLIAECQKGQPQAMHFSEAAQVLTPAAINEERVHTLENKLTTFHSLAASQDVSQDIQRVLFQLYQQHLLHGLNIYEKTVAIYNFFVDSEISYYLANSCDKSGTAINLAHNCILQLLHYQPNNKELHVKITDLKEQAEVIHDLKNQLLTKYLSFSESKNKKKENSQKESKEPESPLFFTQQKTTADEKAATTVNNETKSPTQQKPQ